MGKTAKSVLVFILIIGVAGLLATTGYFYYQYQQVVKNPAEISQKELAAAIKNIERSIDLPDDETPTFATITDKSKVQDQPFFSAVENGDKVLIYPNSRKAILYRPSSKKIVEFAPLVLGVSTATDEAEQALFTIAIYHSAHSDHLVNTVKATLADIEGMTVTQIDSSVHKYTQTQVIDLSGNDDEIVDLLSELLGGEVIEKIPSGERKPEADILVILGSEGD